MIVEVTFGRRDLGTFSQVYDLDEPSDVETWRLNEDQARLQVLSVRRLVEGDVDAARAKAAVSMGDADVL